MFNSLRSRLWLTYALLVGVVIAIIGSALVVYLLRNPTAVRLENQRLRLISALILQRANNSGEFSSATPAQAARLQTAAQRADQEFNVRIAVFDAQGNLLVDSRAGSTVPLPALPPAGSRLAAVLPYFRDRQGKIWLFSERELPGGARLVVAAPRPRTPVLSILRDEFFRPFIQTALIALGLGLLLAYWIARWVAAPLQRMAVAARSVEKSASLAGFEPLSLTGPVEVQTLGQAFNEMTSRVQASQQVQRDFVANVSHELKTPLTSIQGFAQAILDGAADSPEARTQAAQVIFAEAGRMHRLVLDLLDLARLDAGIAAFAQDPVDLGAILQGVVTRFTPLAAQAQIDLNLELQALPVITGDADRLTQVFNNLVDNALQYTPQGGKVWVRARSQENWVAVDVADSGPGIPLEERERIFERFYQTDKARRGGGQRGAGLGLAIVREILQAHGGSIHVEAASQEYLSSQGSVFMVKLPVGPSSLNSQAKPARKR